MVESCKEVLSYFKKLHFDKIGYPYIPTFGRDLKIFKLLLNDIPYKQLCEMITLYFEKQQKFYSPPFFKTGVQEYLAQWQRFYKDKAKLTHNALNRFNNGD